MIHIFNPPLTANEEKQVFKNGFDNLYIMSAPGNLYFRIDNGEWLGPFQQDKGMEGLNHPSGELFVKMDVDGSPVFITTDGEKVVGMASQGYVTSTTPPSASKVQGRDPVGEAYDSMSSEGPNPVLVGIKDKTGGGHDGQMGVMTTKDGVNLGAAPVNVEDFPTLTAGQTSTVDGVSGQHYMNLDLTAIVAGGLEIWGGLRSSGTLKKIGDTKTTAGISTYEIAGFNHIEIRASADFDMTGGVAYVTLWY